MTPEWHLGSPSISVRAITISALALSVPILASAVGATEPARYEALLWLSALIPGFMLAYYRGWSGVATGLAFAMFGFSTTQVYLILSGQRLPDWPYMLTITGALVLGSLVVGEVTDQLHEARERAERMALVDPLTDLPNRRYFDAILEKEFAAAQRGRPLVVVVFGVDGLRKINDQLGRAAGDSALKAFADVLRSYTRAMNLSARLHGDQFVSLVSASTVEGALVFVRRVQQGLTQVPGLAASVTASAGVAPYRDDMASPEDLMRAADEALRDAKAAPGSFVVRRKATSMRVPEGQGG